MSRKVSIVILTWNALDYTKRCLQTLFAETTYPEYEIVVVDNGSTDGTIEWLRSQERVSVVENGRNLGFTAGVNIGLEHVDPTADVITLNNDIVITQGDWIERLQETAYQAPQVGIVGCRLVEPDGHLNHAGSYMPPFSLQGEQLAGRELDVGQYTARRKVQCTVAAVMYVKREVIDKIGGLHKEYFSYYEDTDYCLEATKAGYEIWYAGDVNLLHHHNTSTKVNKVDFWGMYLESKEIFTRRWGKWLQDQQTAGPVHWWSVFEYPRGYAMASKALASALQLAGAQVSYSNVYDQDTEGHSRNPVIEDIKRRPIPRVAPRVAYSQCDYFEEVEGEGPKFGFSMLEVTGLPADWVRGCNLMDEVWVPSQFNVETFRRAGVTKPIEVVPLGVDPDYYHPGVKRMRKTDDFVFLSVFEWGERKNPEMLIRSFAETFKRTDDVVLMLVVGNHDPEVDVESEVAEMRLGADAGRIVICVNPDIPDHQMPALYKAADAFVLPTHGEGWGMPILEAMAVGVPTIATNWSAQTEFFDDSVGFPIEVGSMIDAEARCPFYEGWEWAQPNEEHLRHLMRHVVDDRADAAAKAAAGAERALRYTWKHSAERMLELTRRRF